MFDSIVLAVASCYAMNMEALSRLCILKDANYLLSRREGAGKFLKMVLLSKEQNAEECDARDDDSSNIAGHTTYIFITFTATKITGRPD